MARESTQLAVLGAGPGGYAAAFYAADLGMQVALVDMEKNPGGVCLYRGCIPSKALLHVAKVIDESRHASAWGVTFSDPKIDLDKLRAFKQGVVDKLTSGVGQVGRMRKVKFIQGRATLTGPKSMTIAGADGDSELAFEHCILATGSSPTRIPSLSLDSPRMMDSTSGLDLPDVPQSLLVIGGGYIGLELGTVYATLGSKVSVVEMTGGLLPGADRDLVNVLQKRLDKLFTRIMVNTKVVKVADGGRGIEVTLEGDTSGQQLFDRVLVAVGRRPNSKIPGLEKTAVKIDQRGFIETDAQRRTSEPTMFAIGDVAGEPMLAHKASHEARVAVEAILGRKAVFAPLAIPAVVFTDPEIAWAGLTEAQAQADGRDIEVAKFPWGASGRAISIDRVDGLTKLVLDKKSGRILGVGIAGTGAGELISEGVLAIEMGATAEDMRLTIHPHPTLSETLMESAEVFFGQSTHVYKPKRNQAAHPEPNAAFEPADLRADKPSSR
ncbi:MAG TPA: dihydrolipoyl dehydrogenase [Vicinamibacterales bacterium]|jgi:dihydrolipoamide dehydrogenase|nr:dihydrolipoyl dehydrogenase [Vicinamibacterales bacterium]